MASSSRAMSAIPAEELPILESLIGIRNRLTALKKDSSDFIRPQDVQQLYKEVIKQVTRLNTVRDEANNSSTTGNTEGLAAARPNAQRAGDAIEVDSSCFIATNRVDATLNDVFSLLSLFFLTIGKSRETPATFCQLGCMKQLLDHLAESGIYTEADLQPFSKRLGELRAIVRRDADNAKHPMQLTKLMTRKLEGCEKVLRTLEGTLSVLSVELVPIHQRLVSVRRQIAAAAAKPKPARQEIKLLQEELRKIDSKRVDGKFLGPGGASVPAGQAILVGILEDCFEICHDITVRNDEVPMTLQPIYDRLSEIKGQLEHLVLTHRWTLRETDLWNYQVTLKEIDRLRVDGKFVDSEGKQPEGQLVLLYLLRRCYGLIYRLVASSEPISEELMPISNKLTTVSKCLKEVSKYGGPFTMRDLYPYRLALHQIDAMRSAVKDKEGKETDERKWLGRDGSVPEGQAILRAQFEEVEQTINEMLNREEEDDDDEDDEDDEDWEGSVAASVEMSDDDFESSSALSGDDLASRQASSALVSPAGFSVGNPHDMSSSGLLPPAPPTASASTFSPLAAVAAAGGMPTSPLTPDTARPRHIDASSSTRTITDTHLTPHATLHPTTSSSPPTSVLPPGAATLAAPGSFLAPPIAQMPVLHGLTAREGEPAVSSAAGGEGEEEGMTSSIEALQRQLESGATITPGQSASSSAASQP